MTAKPFLPAAICLAASLAAAAGVPKRATLLFVQDAHQLAPVVDRHGERGGFARLATLVARVRAEEPATLLLFGGDLAGGTLFGGQFRGLPQVEAFNRLGLDAAAFGQHDFDFGSAHTRALVAASRFPWLTSNLVEAATGRPFAGLPRIRVHEVGGLRIALLGLTDDFDTTLREATVEARDLVASAREALAELADPVDAAIALAQTDTPVADRLLREIPRLDAVLIEEQGEDRSVVTWIGARPIAAAAGNLGSVVRLDLKLGEGGIETTVRALPVDAAIPGEPGLERLTAEYEARLQAALGEPLATLATALPAEGARSGESALGSLVADAWRAACASEIALVNAGSLRADLPAGLVRRREVFSVLPFGNRLVSRTVSGADLLAALEHGVRGIAARRGTLLQVSGLRYRVDPDGPDGPRVTAARVSDAPLDPARAYRVALSNYLAGGGDGFWMLARSANAAPPCAVEHDADALAALLSGAAARGPITPPAPGRLILGPGPNPEASSRLVPLAPMAQDVEVLFGDPEAVGEPFVMRIRELPGGVIPPHRHPVDEHLTVLQGTLYFAVGERFDRAAMRELVAGSYAFIPKGSTMFGWTPEAAIVQVHGVGPFHIHWRAGAEWRDELTTLDDPNAASVFAFQRGERVVATRGAGRVRQGYDSGEMIGYEIDGDDGTLFMALEGELRRPGDLR